MFDSLMEVNHAMLGDIKLFMTGRAIKTTAGAYLSQFASLHISVMTNILGSLKYRTEEIAMCSRWYPDVMLCGSMNLPPMLCNPDWPLWRNTKRTMEIRNAVYQFMGNALTALFPRVHSKTPVSLNAVGRIQDTIPIVFGTLECV